MPSITQDMVDEAARRGHLDVLKYFYERGARRCSRLALEAAVCRDHLDIVKLIINNQREEMRRCAINAAAKSGRLEIIKFIFESARSNELWPPGSDGATPASGIFEIVKCQHKHHHSGWAYRVMQHAAAHDRMEVVTYVQAELKGTGCSTAAIDWAAANGHVEVMRYLHAFDTDSHVVYHADGRPAFVACPFADCFECCTGQAMNWAARKGHFEVVQFLFYSRTEGCVAMALSEAASSFFSSSNVVRFLAEHCSDEEIVAVMVEAAAQYHFTAFNALFEGLKMEVSVYPALKAAAQLGVTLLVTFLC